MKIQSDLFYLNERIFNVVTKEMNKGNKTESSASKVSDKSAKKRSTDGILSRPDSPRKVTSLSAAKAASKVLQNAKASAKIKKAADCAMLSKVK